MDFKDFTAGKDDDLRRLDRIVKRIFQNCPEINCQEIIRKRLVRVNEKKATPDTKIHENDVISVADFLLEKASSQNNGNKVSKSTIYSCKKTETDNTEVDFELESNIIFKNRHILIINKPRGVNVQPSSAGESCLSSVISKMFPGDSHSLSFRTGPLHRLDKNTTGLLAFSQSSEGARWFSDAIKNHEIKKTYIGLSQGFLENKERWIDFLEDEKNQSKGFHTMIISKSDIGAKAVTNATPLAYSGDKKLTLVQYDIETGRKHQIRCQSSFHGHPLLGDVSYGGRGNSFYLHAYRLFFPKDNPIGVPEILTCPLPFDFQKKIKENSIKWNGTVAD